MYELFLPLTKEILFNLQAKTEYDFLYERGAKGDTFIPDFLIQKPILPGIPIIFSFSPLKLPLNALLDYNYINFN